MRAASVDEVLTMFLYDLHIHVEYSELNSSTVGRLEDAHFCHDLETLLDTRLVLCREAPNGRLTT